MTAGDFDGNGRTDLFVDFGNAYGLWMRLYGALNPGITWVPLHTFTSTKILTGDLDGNGDAEVIVNFGAAGLWEYVNITRSWVQLHGVGPGVMATARRNAP
jgi:hypothetical protein